MNEFRRLIRLVEAATEQELPGRVAKLLDKPIKITLKDGRQGILTVTRRNDELAQCLSVVVTVDGEHAGSMLICPNRVPPPEDDYDLYAEDRGSWSVADVWVNREFLRQRIATTMYDTLARAGMKILASGMGYGGKLSPYGRALWQSNQPPAKFFSGRLPKPQRFWKPRKR